MANRNMIDVNSALFNCLKEHLNAEHKSNAGDIKRWVNTNKLEKEWLQKTTFIQEREFSLNSQQHLCLVQFKSVSYLACVGFEPAFQSEEFVPEKVNSGFFCAVVDELKLKPRPVSGLSLQLCESVFYPIEATKVVGIGYSLEVIDEFFPEIRLYRIPAGSPLLKPTTAIFRLGLHALTKTTSLLQLPWSDETLTAVRETCTTANEYFPFMLLAHAILERKWEQAFLDVYRCIEFLFPFPKINQLRAELKLSASTIDICASVEEILGWRHQEDIALKLLFEKLGDPQLLLLKASLAIDLQTEGKLSETVSSKVYKLRNECVHYRPLQSKSSIKTNINWVSLLDAMINAVITLHNSEVIFDQ